MKIPGWRLYRASKKFTVDERANDQAFVLADDTGKTALVGDVFVDEARLKAPKPIQGDSDLDSLRELLGRFLRGRIKVSFDPSIDRRSFNGLKIQHETGYGAYDISAFASSWDGALLLVGRAWDRGRSFAEQRRAMIRLDGAPAQGPADAAVTIVEYSDMQCPFCKKRAGDLDALVHKLGKELKIRRVSKTFPISEHTWAFRAASAGRCFYEKDKDVFYSWKSSVFARQETLSVGELDTFALDFAVANGISEEAFRSCYLQGSAVTRVLGDLSEGFAVRVRSTPTYFVDGVPLSWFSDNLMEEYLRKTYLKGAGLPLRRAGRAEGARRGQARRDEVGPAERAAVGRRGKGRGAAWRPALRPLRRFRFYLMTNGSGTTIQVFTFTPSFVAGVHSHCFTAVTLASPRPTLGVVSR